MEKAMSRLINDRDPFSAITQSLKNEILHSKSARSVLLNEEDEDDGSIVIVKSEDDGFPDTNKKRPHFSAHSPGYYRSRNEDAANSVRHHSANHHQPLEVAVENKNGEYVETPVLPADF